MGAVLVAPLLLNGVQHASANATQKGTNQKVERVGAFESESYQTLANQQPQAQQNYRNPNYWKDGNYWTNRVNRAAYSRRDYYHPSINWNARDLGGYYAGHGYYTRDDKVFRGADLHYISQNGINMMRRLHINKVIDLRSHHYQGGKDKRISGVAYRQYPVNTIRQKNYLKPYKNMYGGEIYKYGTSFTTWSQPRWAYRRVFHQLLYHNQNGATYIHCIDGRDRTGIIGALYLSALGVGKWQIYNNYLITNYHKYKHTYRSQVDQLNRFYTTVDRYYGGMSGYLRRGVGLTHHQINRLRQLYLVKK